MFTGMGFPAPLGVGEIGGVMAGRSSVEFHRSQANGDGDGVTGATVDAAGAVSGSNVESGGDGVTGATVAVGGTAEAAGAAELGGSRRTRQG